MKPETLKMIALEHKIIDVQRKLFEITDYIGQLDSDNASLNLGHLEYKLNEQKLAETNLQILINEKIDFLKNENQQKQFGRNGDNSQK